MKIVRCRTNHLENPLGYAFSYIAVTWQVTVWGDADESDISAVNWFETGKMEERWEAKWIVPDNWEGQNKPPAKRMVLTLFCERLEYSYKELIFVINYYRKMNNLKKMGIE